MKWVAAITILVLTVMMYMLSGTLTCSESVRFNLPAADAGRSSNQNTDLVAMMMAHGHETLAFFDDARYIVEDKSQMAEFVAELKRKPLEKNAYALLILADKQVPTGALITFSEAAKRAGVKEVQIATRNEQMGGVIE